MSPDTPEQVVRRGDDVVEVRGAGTVGRIAREADDVVRLSFSVPCGPLPSGPRERLVDAVFAQPELDGVRLVHACVPLGDVELLWRVEEYLDIATTRAAGSSCLLDGAVRPASRRSGEAS